MESDGNVPGGVVRAHFGEVADVADVVADAILVHIGVDLDFASEGLGDFKGF